MKSTLKTILAFLVIGFYISNNSMATPTDQTKDDFIVLNTKDTIYGKVMMLYTLSVSKPYCAKLKFKQSNGDVKMLHPIDIKLFSRKGKIYESALIEENGKDFVFLPLIISGKISYYQVSLNKELGSGFENDQFANAYSATEYRYFIKKEGGQFEHVTKKNFEKIINTYFNDSSYNFVQNDAKVAHYQISKLVEAYNLDVYVERKVQTTTANVIHD